MARKKKKNTGATVVIVVIVLAVLVVAALIFAWAYKNESEINGNSDDTGVIMDDIGDLSDDTSADSTFLTTENTDEDTTIEAEPEENIEISDLQSGDSVELSSGITANISITAPKLTSTTYGETADKFNELITTEIESFKNEFAQVMADPDLSLGELEYKMTYEIYKASEGVVSILLTKIYFTGGAHEGIVYKAVNFDLNSGGSVNMQYVTGVPASEYTPFIKAKVLEQMRAAQTYTSTEDDALDSVFKDDQFLITESGIIVFFQIYDIAPYSEGIQKFEIPYNELIELSSY